MKMSSLDPERGALRLDFPVLISGTCSGIHLPTQRAIVLLHEKSINPEDDSIDLFTLGGRRGNRREMGQPGVTSPQLLRAPQAIASLSKQSDHKRTDK